MRRDPYQVVAGAAIAAFTVDAHDVYIGVKASFVRECDAIERATRELANAGLLGDLDVTIARGPDEYLFGEEKALLEVIEGNDPLPRVLPPFQHGLFATAPQLGWTATEAEPGEAGGDRANPTLVNNVETLAQVTWILAHGADEFRTAGTDTSPGTTVFTLCGDVAAPGVFELPLGTPVRTLIEEYAGGTASGRPVKMVCSGVANAVLSGDRLDTPADFESLARRRRRPRIGGLHRLRRRDVRARRRPARSPGSCTSSRAASARRASCSRARSPTRSNGSNATATRRNSAASSARSKPSPTATAATSQSRSSRSCRASCASSPKTSLPTRRVGAACATTSSSRSSSTSTAPQFVYDERQARKRPDWTYA